MNWFDIEEKIFPLFTNNGFRISAQLDHYVKFESSCTTFTLTYVAREYAFYFHLGHLNGLLTELDEPTMKDFFNENIKSYRTRDIANNLLDFLNGTGQSILANDINMLNRLEAYSREKSKKLLAEFTILQKLDFAKAFWAEKEYSKFIDCLNAVDKSLLPESLIKKYKIALKKIQLKHGVQHCIAAIGAGHCNFSLTYN